LVIKKTSIQGKLPPMAKSIYLGFKEILSFCEDHKAYTQHYIQKQGENRKLAHLRPAARIIAPSP